MYFKEEHTKDYLQIFEETKEGIRNFDGCLKLELLQDHSQEHILTTYSYWRNEKALDNYKTSAFFMKNWGQTKKLFSHKPMAFSCIKLEEVDGIEVEAPTEKNPKEEK